MCSRLRLPHVVSIDFWQYKVEVEVDDKNKHAWLIIRRKPYNPTLCIKDNTKKRFNNTYFQRDPWTYIIVNMVILLFPYQVRQCWTCLTPWWSTCVSPSTTRAPTRLSAHRRRSLKRPSSTPLVWGTALRPSKIDKLDIKWKTCGYKNI